MIFLKHMIYLFLRSETEPLLQDTSNSKHRVPLGSFGFNISAGTKSCINVEM